MTRWPLTGGVMSWCEPCPVRSTSWRVRKRLSLFCGSFTTPYIITALILFTEYRHSPPFKYTRVQAIISPLRTPSHGLTSRYAHKNLPILKNLQRYAYSG